jgi:GDP-L-fucose synthase
MDLKNKKILVTGGAGFLGSFVIKELLKKGAKQKNIFIPRSKTHDLRKESIVNKLTKESDLIIHLAGNVGGIGKNLQYPGTLLYDNILMGTHILHYAMKNKVEKVVIMGTVCAYPKYTPIPFKEEDLWMGYPEETNAPYGLAKKMLLVQSQAYRTQYDLNSIFLLLVNLYGPNDNFDPNSSHVIPALIRRIDEAIKNKKEEIVVWGDGSPTREFIFVEDAAKAIVMATKKYNKSDPINIGSGIDISIKDLVETIAKIMKYKGNIVWDTTKPNGQPKRLLDVSKAYEELGFKARISFEAGLRKTINWYNKQSKNGLI